MKNSNPMILLLIVCCTVISCGSTFDKASRQRRKETLDTWYAKYDPKTGLFRRAIMNRFLLYEAVSEGSSLDSFKVWNRFGFMSDSHFIHLWSDYPVRNEKFYAGEFKEKGDTIFLNYYKGQHPKNMTTYLLTDSSKRVLNYPFFESDKKISLNVWYAIFK